MTGGREPSSIDLQWKSLSEKSLTSIAGRERQALPAWLDLFSSSQHHPDGIPVCYPVIISD